MARRASKKKVVKKASKKRNKAQSVKKVRRSRQAKTQRPSRKAPATTSKRLAGAGRPARKAALSAAGGLEMIGSVRPKLLVIGIGGGGCSIIAEIACSIKEAEFVLANTDVQALNALSKKKKKGRGKIKTFQFGQELTQGLGTGMDPRLGEMVALQEKARIKQMLAPSDLCIVVACLGGGTGSGAAPVFAEIARGLPCLSLGIFTLPFGFEGKKRAEISKKALEKLREHLNGLIIVPNEKVFQIIDKTTPLQTAFSTINTILAQGLSGLIETISRPSLINIDFADLKMLLEGRGRLAYLSSAQANGPERDRQAVRKVLKNPLASYGISGAERILFNISGNHGLKMSEVEHISKEISSLSRKAKVIFGISQFAGMKDQLRITLFGIGCGRRPAPILSHGRAAPAGKPASAKALAAKAEKQESEKPPKENKFPTGQAEKQVSLEPTKAKETKTPHHFSAKSGGGQKPKTYPQTKQGSGVGAEPEKKAKKASVEEVRQEFQKQENKLTKKRNALQVKKAVEQAEQEILRKEKAWESPAFLRRK